MGDDDILYHYTTQKGFLGILENREIWASSIQHLNDASEFTYAVDIALKYVREIEMADDARERLQAMISTFQYTVDVFVASFSSERDQLGQWRAYGHDGGFSIGFDVAALREAGRKHGYALEQCSYDSADHATTIKRLIEEEVPKTPSPDATRTLLLKFIRLAPRLKHSSFEAEKEWRIVTAMPSPQSGTHGTLHRPGKSFFIPYRKLRLWDVGGACPIRKVVVGPNPHPDLSEKTVRACLFANGLTLKGEDVVRSIIPYRDW
jgi:hypothetical protein